MIGREAALRLVGQLEPSGSRKWRVNLYVPKAVGPDHPLVRLVGWHDANRLARHFSGAILQPANCRCLERAFRDREARRMYAEGTSIGEIAAIFEITVRQVRNIVAETAPEEGAPVNDNTAGRHNQRANR